MTALYAALLGVVQGLTEFFPVSSSGHLVLLEHVLPIGADPATLQGFDVLLHAGTILAIFIVYRKQWFAIIGEAFNLPKFHRSHACKLVVASVPAAVIGVLFKDHIAEYFRSPASLTFTFTVTAILLLLRYKTPTVDSAKRITWTQVLTMACFQALAILPGISRSGATIVAGVQTGLHKRAALDFSFQMAVPIIFGATLLTLVDIVNGTVFMPTLSVCISGFVSSFIVSYFALIWLRKFVSRYELGWFAAYLIPLALLCSFL